MAKAILLLSGGLDSTLAGKMLLEMGVEVEAINFVSPFCTCTPKSLGCSAARRAAEQLGIQVRVFSCREDYLETMKHPRFGRGRHMNACLDCRIFTFRRAAQVMAACGADFVATGEVLGERPMSQRREAMDLIEREAGLAGRIVRPLSGRLLPPSEAEQRGLVRREQLADIQGRCRQPQFALAAELGLMDYLCPAGGCLLTDPEFAARFRDLLDHEPDFGVADAVLLRYGRHFRLPSGAKVVCGRHADENAILEKSAQAGDVLLMPETVMGPSVLCRPEGQEDIARAAAILATYIKGGTRLDVAVRTGKANAPPTVLRDVAPLDRLLLDAWRVGQAAKPPPRGR